MKELLFVGLLVSTFLFVSAPAATVDSLHLFYAHQFEDGVDAGYFFGAEIQGSGLLYAGVQNFNGTKQYPLFGTSEFRAHYSDDYASQAEMLADYPAGPWTFGWNGGYYSFSTSTNFPQGVATITSLGSGNIPTFEWLYQNTGGYNAVTATIFSEDGVVYTEKWTSGYYPTQWTPGYLKEGEYELVVGLWNVDMQYIPQCGFLTFSSCGNLNSGSFMIIPEPATLAVLAIGGMLMRRKK